MPAISIYDVNVCEFCSAIGLLNKCVWPVLKEVCIPFAEMVEGDRCKVGHGTYSRVILASRSNDRCTLFYTLDGWRSPASIAIASDFTPTFTGLRTVPCGAWCCENCAAERAPGVHHCSEHWHAWSKAA